MEYQMIFMNHMLLIYDANPDPVKANQFAQQILYWGAQFRGEIPDANR